MNGSIKTVFVLGLLALVPGCAWVSRDGPRTGEIESAPTDSAGQQSYMVVDLDKDLAKTVKEYHGRPTPINLADFPLPRPVGLVGSGDVLRITIWEPAPQQGGIFSGARSPDVSALVDADGTISLPYAGRFSVRGLSLPLVEQEIALRLKGKAYNAQVAVQLADNVANTVFVQGEVGHPGRFPLTPWGSKLMSVIASAGGPKLQPHEAIVQVRRSDKTFSADLYRIMSDPSLNILLSPGDDILVSKRQDMFFAFGATRKVGQVPFNQYTTTLLQALGAISGLQDERADPQGIFIFRREPKDLADRFPKPAAAVASNDTVPIVYRLDMENPSSFFILDTFPVRPSDIVYVSNAPMTEVSKVMNSIMGSTGNLMNTGLSAAAVAK
ncbi:MAG: polysaccharide export protein [Alphaproteobacteria bacterium]|nr:polysaccharide export protein [Alphaproteobacteria bacterium]